MEQIYAAFTETLIPWVEERFGQGAAWIAAILLIALPIGGIVLTAWRLMRP